MIRQGDESEEVKLAATQDDTIMADGRPAYAWWNEIQMIRKSEQDIGQERKRLYELYALLSVEEIQSSIDQATDSVMIKIKKSRIVAAPTMHQEEIAKLAEVESIR